jgi:phenol 2-monooxygenase (NADPH)
VKRVLILFRVFIDDVDTTGRQGGDAYETYGIGHNGAIVVVRPDGYVGMVAPLENVAVVEEYFAGSML